MLELIPVILHQSWVDRKPTISRSHIEYRSQQTHTFRLLMAAHYCFFTDLQPASVDAYQERQIEFR